MKNVFSGMVGLGVAAIATFAARGAVEKPELIVGVVSDVHTDMGSRGGSEERRFRKVLAYFDRRKVDVVIGGGDYIEIGWRQWLQRFGDLWFEVFPDGKRSDGQPIEKVFAYGDHEIEHYCDIYLRQAPDRAQEYDITRDPIPLYGRGKIYEEAFREPWAPVMHKRVKGYDFVIGHFTMFDGPDGAKWGKVIPGAPEFLTTNRFDRTRPFFYVQHKPVAETAISPDTNYQSTKKIRQALDRHPNAVALFGDRHPNCVSEYCLWQDTFTCIAAPAMQYTCTDSGHENGSTSDDNFSERPPRQMPGVKLKEAGAFLVMLVYRDRIVVERRNAEWTEKVAEDWVIRTPTAKRKAASFEARQAKAKPAVFPADAAVKVTCVEGKDRRGNPSNQYVVTFPQAKVDDLYGRAFDYRVTAVVRKHWWTRTACEKWVYSERYNMPARFDTNDITCVFGATELSGPWQEAVFTVTPYNAFHVPGAPIRSEKTKPGFRK